jgi:cytosine/adenosine deaminase-related metal-dependent hydrolase
MFSSSARMPESDPTILIHCARYATGPCTVAFGPLEIVSGILHLHCEAAISGAPAAIEIDLGEFLLFPGLINAHDHLQYALHPKLGRGSYRNYIEWGDDIHAAFPSLIARYNAVPKSIRLWWGGIRNLLSGVTTVCHHDPLWPTLQLEDYPVKVLRNYRWTHSLALAPNIREAWAATPSDSAFFVHACEGTDDLARAELFGLDRMGVLDARTVIVHGLALDDAGVRLMQERHSSLILCPSSNLFLYRRIPDVAFVREIEATALGSDSPLTALGDLLDEVRFGIASAAIPSERAYRMVTEIPATMLRLRAGEGRLRDSSSADFFAIRDNGDPPHTRLRTLSWRDIEFVMISGQVQLASHDVWNCLPLRARQGLEPLLIEGQIRWLRAPVRQLLLKTEATLGIGMVRLGGRAVKLVDDFIPVSPEEAIWASGDLEGNR